MSFANINIGTTPGDHSGDPLRTAFNKINSNFQQIANGNVAINVTAPVTSVAGRTGNITLTASDVIGSITMGDVNQALTSYAQSYPTKSDLQSNIAAVIGGAPSNLNTLGKIAQSLGNNASLSSQLTGDISSLNSEVTDLWANALVQTESIQILESGLDAANLVIAQNSADIQTLFANAASQATYLLGLTSNAASQASELNVLTANAATQSANLLTLFSNAATQDASLTSLLANAATQQASLTTLLANTASLQSEIEGANAAIISANTALKGYVDIQIASVNQAWGANAESVQTQLTATNVAIVTANTALKSYVDASNSSMKSYVDASDLAITTAWTANAATQAGQIVTANTALKGYVDASDSAITSAWTANAATQQGLITTLQSQVYSNSNVAAYLPTHTGNIGGGNLIIGSNVSAHAIGGNVVIGLSTVPSTSTATFVTINANQDPPIPAAGILHVTGEYGRSAQITLDNVSSVAGGSMMIRRARGTNLSPTAVQQGDILGSYQARGYGNTAFGTGSASALSIHAAENFTDTSQSTYATISIVKSGSTTPVVHSKFDSSGNLVIVNGSPSTSTNTGALVVVGGAGIAGNVHTSGNVDSSRWVNATLGLTTSTAVYSPAYYFANGSPFSIPFDTNSANVHIQTYGDNAYIAKINMSDSVFTGDGSGLPLTLDFTDVVVSHMLHTEGTLIANATTQATTAYNGAFIIPNGGAGIQGNLFCAIQANTRIQAGQGGAYLPNVIGQFTSDVNNYSQVNMQNLHHGSLASSDFVVTADNGSDTENFGDFGIANSQYMYPGYEAIQPNDTYLIANGGDLLINAGSPTKNIKFAVGGSDVTNIVGTWSNVALTSTTDILLAGNLVFDASPAGAITGASSISTTNLTVLGNISYTPANASNWNTTITSVYQALDELAQRLKTAGF